MRKNPTEAERVLWRLLRNKRLAGSKWKRQEDIGPYIVDFICYESRLIVEADGSQRIDSAYDAQRDAWLRGENFRLLRFYNNDILARSESVLTSILNAVKSVGAGIEPAPTLTPLPSPPPQGGREQKAV